MRRPTPAVARRRRLVAAGVLVLAAAAISTLAGGAPVGGDDRSARELRITDGQRTLVHLPLETHAPNGTLDRMRVARTLRQRLPQRRSVRRDGVSLVVHYDVAATVERTIRAGASGSEVAAVRRVLSSRIDAPVIRQAQRNTCESAALEILLAAQGVRVDQGVLQKKLPRSGSLDPEGEGPQRVWGDPERGYVGRPDGGGTAGGFGVYQGPVAKVAAAEGVRLHDISGRQPSEVYARLADGRAVMVWVGLTEGPYGQWTSPEGRRVRVNFGEHTVVLTGLTSDGALRVSNPLEGTAETWSRESFELMWTRLDRRALST
jgi:uncharacterized protein YvpB